MTTARRIVIEEGRAIPRDGLLLGWAAMIPLAAAAALAWMPDWSALALEAGRGHVRQAGVNSRVA